MKRLRKRSENEGVDARLLVNGSQAIKSNRTLTISQQALVGANRKACYIERQVKHYSMYSES